MARAIIQELLVCERERPLYLLCRTQLELFYNKFGFQRISSKEMPVYFQRISHLEHILT